ncbi:hypothetical protein COU36_00510 [Candidatus Micrarchaeota archaeon CG10_big_fil_rev_8_21_14_0_10_59_7]|nr:MAG: hypothetical protein COU36_00510 [Candidatus Micrarchaeota archaeon CG10_big_fil_rev_8_21_14_0_10_59_7]
MNVKPLAMTALMLGSLLLALSAYELNQYMTTNAAIAPSMAQLNELSKNSEALAELGMGASDLESTRQALSNATAALMQATLIDLCAGALFVALGVAFYPREQR